MIKIMVNKRVLDRKIDFYRKKIDPYKAAALTASFRIFGDRRFWIGTAAVLTFLVGAEFLIGRNSDQPHVPVPLDAAASLPTQPAAPPVPSPLEKWKAVPLRAANAEHMPILVRRDKSSSIPDLTAKALEATLTSRGFNIVHDDDQAALILTVEDATRQGTLLIDAPTAGNEKVPTRWDTNAKITPAWFDGDALPSVTGAGTKTASTDDQRETFPYASIEAAAEDASTKIFGPNSQ